jgi:DNA polymerase-3 subunit beta
MKITITRHDLLENLIHQNSVVDKKRTTVPVLMHCLIRTNADMNSCEIIGTDLDTSLSQILQCEVLEEGAATFPVQMVCDIVRRLSDDQKITLQVKNGQLQIKSGRSIYKLPSLAPDIFPVPALFTPSVSFDISKENILHLINKTRLFMSTDGTRHSLNGTYLHTIETEGKIYLRAVTTDGHRLALADIEFDQMMSSVIVLRKTINEAKSIIEDSNADNIMIKMSDNEISFEVGQSKLTAKLVEGGFPNYLNAIPKNEEWIDVDANELHTAVSRIAIVCEQKTVKIHLNKDSDSVLLSSNDNDGAYAEEEIKTAKKQLYASIDVGFNSRYISDIIASNTSSSILRLRVNSANASAPSVFEYPDVKNCTYVLMPMRM